MELMISSITTKKKNRELLISNHYYNLSSFSGKMFSLQNEGRKKRKKGFPIKCLTGWYHPILQDVENSPHTWPDEGWSSPRVVWDLPDVAAWPDRSLLAPARRGLVVKKRGSHAQG